MNQPALQGGSHNRKQREWIIQRCTQRWIGTELQYEDFPTPDGVMNRNQMIRALERVSLKFPDSEFKGHRIAEPGHSACCNMVHELVVK